MFLYLPFQNVHAPMQVPKEYEDMYPDIEDDDRRVFSGMVTALDDAVGSVVDALQESGMYDNSVIVFLSDNGGSVLRGGNNFPLRGNKVTLWEGGTRTPSFVHSPLLKQSGYVSHELIHITDWLPTLLHLAGADDVPAGDGFNQWDTISQGAASPRTEMVYNIEADGNGNVTAALRVGDLKLVWGENSTYSGWYPAPGSDKKMSPLLPLQTGSDQNVYLFNVTADPIEHEDLSQQMPEAVAQLQARVLELLETMVPADVPAQDEAGEPVDGVWFTGWCEPK